MQDYCQEPYQTVTCGIPVGCNTRIYDLSRFYTDCEGIQEYCNEQLIFVVVDDTFTYLGRLQDYIANAYTTVSSLFVCAQLLRAQVLPKCVPARRFLVANSLQCNLVNQGKVSSVVSTSPNGLETNSYRLLNYLANLITFAAADVTVKNNLLFATGTSTIVQAILFLAQNPFFSTNVIWNFNVPATLKPTIETEDQIGQWALSIKVNSTGNNNYLPCGPATFSFDKRDRVWVSLNTVSGTDGSNTFSMVLGSNAQPVNFSPVFGVLGGAFGNVYIPSADVVAIPSFGWGANNVAYNPRRGAVTYYNAQDGKPMGPPGGYDNKLHRGQGLLVDLHNNLWMTSWGSQAALGSFSIPVVPTSNDANSSVVVYINLNPAQAVSWTVDDGTGPSPNYGTFGIAKDSLYNVFVTNGGSFNDKVSSIIKLRLINNVIVEQGKYVATQYEFYKGVAVDSKNQVYVASQLEDNVLVFTNSLTLLYNVAADGPWGLHIDSADTLWIANFSGLIDISSGFSVAKVLSGSNVVEGKFVLPSGGQPVTLADGSNVKINGMDTYEPLMRLTGAVPDASGALYCANNWLPGKFIDINGAPGGDGVVVFLGIAAPRSL